MSEPVPHAAAVRCFDTLDEVSAAVAREFVALARDAIAAKGRCAVALTGGTTPRRLYRLLGAEPLRSEVCWRRVHLFFGDERAVAPTHPDSNYGMVRDALLDAIDIPPHNVHRMPAERADLDAAAAAYEAELADVFGRAAQGSPPRFDVVLLGMGEDGHTASLFPGTPALAERSRWVVGVEAAGVATRRMTLTLPVLNSAAHVWILVSGAAKQQALRQVLAGDGEHGRLPAAFICPASGELTWFVDRAAAAGVTG